MEIDREEIALYTGYMRKAKALKASRTLSKARRWIPVMALIALAVCFYAFVVIIRMKFNFH